MTTPARDNLSGMANLSATSAIMLAGLTTKATFALLPTAVADVVSDIPDADADAETKEDLFEIPHLLEAVLYLLYAMIVLVSLCGNILVIFVIVRSQRMHTVTNYYIANLAVSDVTIAAFATPFQFRAALLQRWDLPQFMCQFCPLVTTLSLNVSIITLVAIAIDRYKAIMDPFKPGPSKQDSKIVILLIWVFSLLFAAPMGYFYQFRIEPVSVSVDTDLNETTSETKVNATKPFCALDISKMDSYQHYTIVLFIVEYVIPLFVISVAYTRIGWRLWLSTPPGVSQANRDNTMLKNKKKVIKMLMFVVLIFAFCWVPWQIFMLLTLFSPSASDYKYINLLFFGAHWLAMSNSCYNPFIYGIFCQKFRREFSVTCPCLISPPQGGGATSHVVDGRSAVHSGATIYGVSSAVGGGGGGGGGNDMELMNNSGGTRGLQGSDTGGGGNGIELMNNGFGGRGLQGGGAGVGGRLSPCYATKGAANGRRKTRGGASRRPLEHTSLLKVEEKK